MRLYFDYAASTPVDPRVLEAMQPYFRDIFGNPGSLHSFGQEALSAVDASRETIAKAIGAEFREIIFTGSATEANNLALRGAIRVVRNNIKNPKIIISCIEHESVLETAQDLEKDGAEVVRLPVDKRGIVDPADLARELNERTALVSIMYANNEIGAVNNIERLSRTVSDFRNDKFYPLLHTDAAQALQFLDCGVEKLGIDLMTLSAHKIYGPKGVGALYIRNGSVLAPILTGGGQEFGWRSGTENVPAIVGFSKAVELIGVGARLPVGRRELESKRILELRDYFWDELKKICSQAEINGPENSADKLPNIINVYFPGRKAEDLLAEFDLAGLAVSAGSACRSRAVDSSYVIEALGYPKERARQSIRFSLGGPTTKVEVDNALTVIKNCL
ncbi:MAG: cysteine desulfurase [Patescibacteria group bacterium]|nr:cysteine desulfurase [Patescibacteria group bacterium]MDE2015080.1 cysteine desulfurase [Patescibacteria group bacterium]MDE2226508.1 cysteine desulfurase [Patescibacteria group bacterium]